LGLLNFFARRKALSASTSVVEALQDRHWNPYPLLGGTNQRVSTAYQRGIDASYGWIYGTQPAVRSVIHYIADNSAQLGLKLYERVDDNERERREDHPAAKVLKRPDGIATTDAWVYRLITDFLIWDNAYALKIRPQIGSRLVLVRLPPGGVTVTGGRFIPERYVIWRQDGTFFEVDPKDVLHWYGYNPDDSLLGLSKLETLRQELAADRANQAALLEIAKSGLKGGYIKRPLDAPEWSQPDAERFAEQWREAKQRRNGRDPILDEGMEFQEVGISPKDAELIPSRRFTKEEVASLYGMKHVPPEGEEEREQFLADVLPPLVERLAGQFNVDVLEAEYGESDLYFEFDLNEKLRGDPEKRFSAITSSVGAPWLTRNEARAMENKPSVEGGDELITPANVIVGDNPRPAPNVMPIQDPNGPMQDGSHRETPKALATKAESPELPQFSPRVKADMDRQRRNISEMQALLLRFYRRQAKTVKSKAAFDSERWNQELTKDLRDAITRIIEREGATYVGRLGGADFDLRQVKHYIDAMSSGVAEALNEVTQRDLQDATARDAIERAMNERAEVAGTNIGARATVFARQEAAKQSPTPERRMQTWVANTKRHGRLAGATVPLGETWGGITPGSQPNCACTMTIS
jgi:HK97 family phage portal protein